MHEGSGSMAISLFVRIVTSGRTGMVRCSNLLLLLLFLLLLLLLLVLVLVVVIAVFVLHKVVVVSVVVVGPGSDCNDISIVT